MIKILLLEDDLILGETIHEMLVDAGYNSVWTINGEAAAEATYNSSFDLYVFDINVPKLNGFDLLESLRKVDDNTPTIFMSAMTDIVAITKGFSAGADDYLKKPFYPEELLLRVESRFTSKKQLLMYKGISYDPILKEVKKNSRVLSFGEVQLALLSFFIENIGRTLSKDSLLDLMEHPSDSALRVAINKLRHTTGWDIENIRGIGYRIDKS